MLMVLYSTGMRNAELRHLQVADIDSRRMLIHIQRGKGGRDRYVPLSPTLLATLRVYYRWMRPKTWLFPGTVARLARRQAHHAEGPLGRVCRRGPARRAAQARARRTCCAIPMPRTCSRVGADLRTIQLLLGHVEVRHTVLYLHLSQRHLQAVANPLDALHDLGARHRARTRLKHKR